MGGWRVMTQIQNMFAVGLSVALNDSAQIDWGASTMGSDSQTMCRK